MKILKEMFGFLDLTKGKVYKVILLFALPLLLTTLLTNSLNLVNTMVLKNTVGGTSVTAMNQTNSLNSILLNFALGCTAGFATIGGHYFGKKDEQRLKESFHTSIILSIFIGAFLSVVGLIILKPALKLLNVNEEFFTKAYKYYFIMLIGYIILILNQLLISYLRALGNSFVPFLVTLVSMLLQILLVFLLTNKKIANLDTVGCAIAYLINNLLCVVINYLFLIKKYKFLHLTRNNFHFKKEVVNELLKQGLPLGFQWSILFIGSFVLTSQINLFGPDASNAMTVYTNLESYSTISFSCIGQATLAFVSQNYGAKNTKRIKNGIKWAFFFSLISYVFVFIVGYSIIPYSPYIFLSNNVINDEVKFFASTYLYILYPSFFLQGVILVSRNSLIGIKKPLIPLISGIGELFMRISISLLVPYIIDPNYKVNLSRKAYIGISFSNSGAWLISALIMGISVFLIIFLNKNFSNLEKNNMGLND